MGKKHKQRGAATVDADVPPGLAAGFAAIDEMMFGFNQPEPAEPAQRGKCPQHLVALDAAVAAWLEESGKKRQKTR